MKLNHRQVLVATGAAIVLALGGHLQSAGSLTATLITPFDPVVLATEIVGPGITIDAATVTYSGATTPLPAGSSTPPPGTPAGTRISSGKFSGDPSIIGFDSGIVLSTGHINNIIGPNRGGATASFNSKGLGDGDLGTLSGFTTFDATVLSFDFVPDRDKVFIYYAFASEEYNEFVNQRVGGK